MRLTFYGGEIFFYILVPKRSTFISKLILLFIGALFGPAMTKWYQFLNRIKFPSPTKALIYRVSTYFRLLFTKDEEHTFHCFFIP